MVKIKFNLIFAFLISIFLIGVVSAADPGHGAASIGAGTFEAGNYVFPNNISVSGFIGIGTTTPSMALDVRGAGNFSGLVYVNNGTEILNYINTNINGNSTNATASSYWNSSNNVVYLKDLLSNVSIGGTIARYKLEISAMNRALNVSGNLYVNNTNIGIGGVVNPLRTLEINGTQAFQGPGIPGTYSYNSTSNLSGVAGFPSISQGITMSQSTDFSLWTQRSYGSDYSEGVIAFGDDANSALSFEYWGWNGSAGTLPPKSILYLKPTGNIGIGTTVPAYTLDVNGSINAAGFYVNGSALSTASNGTSTYVPYSGALNNVNLGTWNLTTTGRIGIGTTTPNYDLNIYSSANNPYIQLTSGTTGSDSNQGLKIGVDSSSQVLINQTESSNLFFATNSITRIAVDSSGRVGIGTTTPSMTLDVRGMGNFSGTIWLNNNTDVISNLTVLNNFWNSNSTIWAAINSVNSSSLSGDDWNVSNGVLFQKDLSYRVGINVSDTGNASHILTVGGRSRFNERSLSVIGGYVGVESSTDNLAYPVAWGTYAYATDNGYVNVSNPDNVANVRNYTISSLAGISRGSKIVPAYPGQTYSVQMIIKTTGTGSFYISAGKPYPEGGNTISVTETRLNDENLGNGWHRITQTSVINSNTVNQAILQFGISGGSIGDVFYVYNLQWENGTVPTSYTETQRNSGDLVLGGKISSLGTLDSSYFAGKVGIGTATPAYQLEVNAANKALNVSNNLYVNSTSVGIGTATPGAKFEVRGDAILNSSSDSAVNLRIVRNSATGRAQFTLENETGGQLWRVGATGAGSEDFVFYNGVSNALVINRSSGKVGIGINAPTYTLDVNGAINASGFYVNGSALSTASNGTSTYVPYSGALNNVNLGTWNLTTTGRVGIGTSNPLAQLELNGSFRRTGNDSVGEVEQYIESRVVGSVSGSATQIGTFTFTNGAGYIELDIVSHISGYSTSAVYFIPVQYDNQDQGNSSQWLKVQPISYSGDYSGNEVELDINVSTSTAALRLRRVSGNINATHTIDIKTLGNSVTFTPINTSTTGVSAPLTVYGSSILTQRAGKVGIGTINPAYQLEVSAMNRALNVSSNLYVNNTNVGIGTSNPSAKLDVVSTAQIARNGLAFPSDTGLKFVVGNALNTAQDIKFITDSGASLGASTGISLPTYGSGIFSGYGVNGGSAAFYGSFSSDSAAYIAGGSNVIKFGSFNNPPLSTASGSVTFTEKARFDTNGNLGIGTTTPTQKLDVNGIVNASGFMVNGTYLTTGSNVSGSYVPYVGALSNVNLGSKNLSTTGFIGAGIASPTSPLDVVLNGGIVPGNATTITHLTQGGNGGPILNFRVEDGGTAVDGNGETLGRIAGFGSYAANAYVEGARIDLVPEGAFNATSAPSYITLSTSAINSVVPAERFRINSNGSVGIGTTTPSATLDVRGAGNFSGDVIIRNSTSLISNLTVLNNFWNSNTTIWNAINSVNSSSGTNATSTYVPYLGASKAVNLGSNNLTTSGTVQFGNLSTSAIQNIVPIYIRGIGNNDISSQVLEIGGVTIYSTGSRGLRLTIINKTNYVVINDTNYDTYGSATASATMADALNNMTDLQFGVITSYDAWPTAFTAGLRLALEKKGLFVASQGSNTYHRAPYAAIFEAGNNTARTAKAVEVMHDAVADSPYAEIRGWLIDGSFVATGNVPNAVATPTGAPALISDVSGNIGIGTTSPSYKVDVNGTAHFVGNVTVSGWITNLSNPLVTTDAATKGYVDTAISGANSSFALGDDWNLSSGNLFAKDYSYNVSIGTNSANSAKFRVASYNSTLINAQFENIETNQELNFLISQALTGSWPPVNESLTHTIQSSGASGGNIAFATGNSEIARFTTNARFGIGTTSPSMKLDVRGEGNFSGDVFIRNSTSLISNLTVLNNFWNSNATIWAAINSAPTGTNATATYVPYVGATKNTALGSWNLTTTGWVGIGTASPTSTLDAVGTSILGPTGSKTISGISAFSDGIKASAAYRLLFYLPSSQSNNRAHLTLQGQVGGWTSAQGKALVSMTIATRDANRTVGNYIGDLGNNDIRIYLESDGNYSVWAYFSGGSAYTTPWSLSATGNIITGTSASVSYPVYVGGSTAETTTPPTGTLVWSLATNSQQVLRSSGNFGVNSTAPAHTLEVSGTFNASNNNGGARLTTTGDFVIGI